MTALYSKEHPQLTRCNNEYLQLSKLKAQSEVLLPQISNLFNARSGLPETSAKLLIDTPPPIRQTSRGYRALNDFTAQQFSVPQQGENTDSNCLSDPWKRRGKKSMLSKLAKHPQSNAQTKTPLSHFQPVCRNQHAAY